MKHSGICAVLGLLFAQNSQTDPVSYSDEGQLTGDAITAGLLSGITTTMVPNALGQEEGLGVTVGETTIVSHAYTYDSATGRLASASDLLRGVSAAYGYTANSNWNSAVNTSSAGTLRLQTSRTPDGFGRLAAISSTVPGQSAPVESHTYHYNAKGLREEVNVAGGEKWVYGYNGRNEVTSGVRRLDSGADVPGTSFGYNFDAIGNRTSTTVNGRTASYTQNGQSLNQYGEREVPGFIDVSGTATAAALVQVNGVTATRQGSRYWAAAPVDDPATTTVESNAAAPVWATIAVKAYLVSGGGAQDTKQILPQPNAPQHRFVPKTPEVFKYDADGNMEEDGRWKYTWDGENRLIQMDTLTAAISAGVPRKQLKFVYDALGRRVQKEVWDPNTSGNLALSRRERFIYQTGGWNLLARVNGLSSNALEQSYLWGLDLSGSLSGFGGVGGLLALYDQPSVQSYLPSYDGSGNVMALTAAANGAEAARYSYGPLGETVLTTGPKVQYNPFRFSTKYQDQEAGLLYYGYRYYQAQTGRWISKDPLEERGGENLYAFVFNSPLNWIDILGRRPAPVDPLTNVINQLPEDIDFKPDKPNPYKNAGNTARGVAEYWKVVALDTGTQDCCGGEKRYVWKEGSPKLSVGYELQDGAGYGEYHEKAHVWGAIAAYQEAKTGIESVLNQCLSKLKAMIADDIIANRKAYFGDLNTYYDLSLHAGTHPEFGATYQYGDGDPFKPTPETIQKWLNKVEAHRRKFNTLRTRWAEVR